MENREQNTIITNIASALASEYTDLYYVNMDTDELIEFHGDEKTGELVEVRRSNDFFYGCRRDVKLFVHPDDQDYFVKCMDRGFLYNAFKKSRIFEMIYRRKIGDDFSYVQMRVTRVSPELPFVVLAVSDIDELMKKRKIEERMMEERIIYARLHAITGNFIVIYVVDPLTDNYREFSATQVYDDSFGQAKEGSDFFGTVRRVSHEFNHPADLDRFLTIFTKENVMAEIEKNGTFSFGYRLMVEGRPTHVQMKAAMVEEKEGPRLIVGLNNIDAQVRQEEEMERRLIKAQDLANIDALTGVRNKHAYFEAESKLDRKIEDKTNDPFAVVMMDMNDLKLINDTQGHQAGDEYIRQVCKIVCDIFKHSPVYRVGGDEFVVIAQGEDYEQIDERIKDMADRNAKAKETGDIVIACGMSKFDNDESIANVFQRADHNMYANKNALKDKN